MTALQIYVGNLSYDTTEPGMEEHFSQYGKITIAKVVKDRETNRSRGFGFVTFDTAEAAQAALAANGTTLDGKQLRVNLAHEDARRGGAGGGGMGGGAGRPPRAGGGGYRPSGNRDGGGGSRGGWDSRGN